MNGENFTIIVDGVEVEARAGQTIMQACDEAGIYIPRLCHHPELKPVGHCRVCTCKVDRRLASSCAMPAANGMVVENNTPELNADRRTIIEMLFVEGNHFCPACEKSGSCELQALAYRLGVMTPQLPYLWPQREIDASHPDIYIDRNRCILCTRCVRASETVDGKALFGIEGRGIGMHLNVEHKGHLDESELSVADKAANVCPVGCIVIKRTGYRVPAGSRPYDLTPIGSNIEARRAGAPR